MARPVPAAVARPVPAEPSATLRVVPAWTYQDDGKIAVIAACSERADLRVVTSKMLPSPVILSKGGKLLIKLTHKTHPSKYAIMLFCTGKNKQTDVMDMKSVRIPRAPRRFQAAGAAWLCRSTSRPM